MSLYVKNGIQYKLRENFKNNENLFERVFIEIDKNEFGSNKNIIIGVIYKPPNTSVKSTIFDKRRNGRRAEVTASEGWCTTTG